MLWINHREPVIPQFQLAIKKVAETTHLVLLKDITKETIEWTISLFFNDLSWILTVLSEMSITTIHYDWNCVKQNTSSQVCDLAVPSSLYQTCLRGMIMIVAMAWWTRGFVLLNINYHNSQKTNLDLLLVICRQLQDQIDLSDCIFGQNSA